MCVRPVLGQPDQLRAPVLRVLRALDVAELLQVVDDLADGLLGHAGALGEVGEPRAALVDEAEDAAVALADGGVPRLTQARLELAEAVAREVVEQGR